MPAFTSKYAWRSGYGYKVPAAIVGGVIESLPEITSENLLEASRPEDSPTHSLFEWDDSIAAERYRRHQATCVINAIEVTIVENDKVYQAPAFVNVVSKGIAARGMFSQVEVALANDDTRQAVLANALKELRSFQKKYAGLTELAGVMEEITRLKEAG